MPPKRLAGIRWWLAGAMLACALPPACLAERTVFEPVFALNLLYVDSEGELENQSYVDLVLRLDLELPVVRRFDRGSLKLAFSPSLVKFREARGFDTFDQRYYLNFNHRPTERSTLSIASGFSLQQIQGAGVGFSETGSVFTRRFDRRLRYLDVNYRHQVRPTWIVGTSFGVSDLDLADLARFEPRDPFSQLEDRTDYRGRVELLRILSKTSTLGLALDARRFDLERSGVENVYMLSVIGRHEFTRTVSIWFSLGGFESRGDSPQSLREGLQAEISLRREFKRRNLGLSFSRLPTAGGILAGTSVDTSLTASLDGELVRRARWYLTARQFHRDPADAQLPDIDSLQIGGRIETAVHSKLGLRFGADWLRQKSDARRLRGTYYSLLSGLVWYPLGQRESLGLPGAIRPVTPGEP